jgi:hypothetical protein
MTGTPRVAATGHWFDEDGTRLPAGEVHTWYPGQNQTLCGLPLSRAGLERFAGVSWADVMPESGGAADAVSRVCRRCAAGSGRHRGRRWTRTDARP